MKVTVPLVGRGPKEMLVPLLRMPDWELEPYGDMLLVERMEDPDKTESGIVLPESVRDTWIPRYRVLAVGPGRMLTSGVRAPIVARVGDCILLQAQNNNRAIPIPDRKRETALVGEEAIVAIARDKSGPHG